ncbi:MAG: amidase [Micropepsaceae bacterium]
MFAPLHFQSLSSLVHQMREGKISVVDVTEHHLKRIVDLEPMLHAFAQIRADEARVEARAADARRSRGEPLGMLHGAPMAVKDLCAMAGTETRAGGFFSTGFKPADTATVVRRLQDAGAIIIGKAQLTEGAWGTHHPDIMAPVNPWAPHRWSGSSSSGSGVSVAAGLAAGAIGTDTAGSIRYPSAANGLVGLKPTWGRVSRHGVFPLSDTFDHIGPMARTVQDAALIFASITGVDAADPTSLDVAADDWVGAARNGTLKGVRIGVDQAYTFESIDPVMAETFGKALNLCVTQGGELVDVSLPAVDDILVLAIVAAFAEAAISHEKTYPSQQSRYSAGYSEILDIGHRATGIELARVAIWRREFAGYLARTFKFVDLLAVPVLPMPPLTVTEMAAMSGSSPLAAAGFMKFTIPFNLASQPTLTLPMGRLADQTPLGFQFVGPVLGERAILSAGAAYEKAAGFVGQYPSL